MYAFCVCNTYTCWCNIMQNWTPDIEHWEQHRKKKTRRRNDLYFNDENFHLTSFTIDIMHGVHDTRIDFDVVNKMCKICADFRQIQYLIRMETSKPIHFLWFFFFGHHYEWRFVISTLKHHGCKHVSWSPFSFHLLQYTSLRCSTMNKNVVVVVVMPSKCIEHVNQALDNSSIYCCCSNGINVGSSLIYKWSTQSSRSTKRHQPTCLTIYEHVYIFKNLNRWVHIVKFMVV